MCQSPGAEVIGGRELLRGGAQLGFSRAAASTLSHRASLLPLSALSQPKGPGGLLSLSLDSESSQKGDYPGTA